jgi:ComEC/Rec2-related protein
MTSVSKKKSLFHKLVTTPLYCSISILQWVTDFQIVFVSFSIIFFSYISLKLYYEIFQEGNLEQIYLFLCLIPPLTLLIYIWYVSYTKEGVGRYVRKAVQIFFILIILSFRLLLLFKQDVNNYQNSLSFTGQLEQYEVTILDISKQKGSKQSVKFLVNEVGVFGYVNWFEKISVGDICQVEGEILRPKNFDSFDYVKYLQNRNVYGVVNRVQILECTSRSKNVILNLKRILLSTREELSRRVEMSLPEPQASLLIGILFGSSRAFAPDFSEYLRISGTTHIISASGYNVSVLILVCNKVFGFLNKKSRMVFSLIIVWMFSIFSGFGASIVRAAIIGSLTISSVISGRVRNIHIVFPFGIALFVIFNPKVVFDIGLQLSVLATMGLIYVLPSIQNLFKKFKPSENILSTISCTICTLPISISVFGKVSLVSIFANILVLPLTQSTMLYGFVALLSSFLSSKISLFLFSIPFFQLKLFEVIVEYIGKFEWGYVDVSSNIVSILITVFVLLFCSYFYPVDIDNYYIKNRYEV